VKRTTKKSLPTSYYLTNPKIVRGILYLQLVLMLRRKISSSRRKNITAYRRSRSVIACWQGFFGGPFHRNIFLHPIQYSWNTVYSLNNNQSIFNYLTFTKKPLPTSYYWSRPSVSRDIFPSRGAYFTPQHKDEL
jgi:hypothetical protein